MGLAFWRRALADPGWTAVIEPDGTRQSAGELLARVNRLTHGLRALGLRPGDGIAGLLPNGRPALEVYLAALQGGWYYTPVNWHFTAPEIAYIVADSEAQAFFVHERYAAAGAAAAEQAGVPAGRRFGYGAVPGFMPGGQPAGGPACHAAGRPDLRAPACTTPPGPRGAPRGSAARCPAWTRTTPRKLNAALFQFFGAEPGQPNVHLVTSPNYHTAVTVFGGAAIHLGHTLAYMDSWDAETALACVERYQVTSTHMVPTHFKRMLDLPEATRRRYDVSSMRWLLHAAAPCPAGLKRAMLDWWGPRVYEYYAATEGGGTIATPRGLAGPPRDGGQAVAGQRGHDRRRGGPRVPARPARHRLPEDDAVRLRVQGRPGQDRGRPAARLLHRRGHRLPGRRRLPVPLRPQVRHDHLRRGEHLPGRDRGGDHHASRGWPTWPCSVSRTRTGGSG